MLDRGNVVACASSRLFCVPVSSHAIPRPKGLTKSSPLCPRYIMLRSVISSPPRADGLEFPAEFYHPVVVNIQTRNGIMGFRMFRLLLETDGAPIRPKLSTTP